MATISLDFSATLTWPSTRRSAPPSRLPADQRAMIETWLEGDLSKWRLENLRGKTGRRELPSDDDAGLVDLDTGIAHRASAWPPSRRRAWPRAAVLPDHMPSSHRRYTDWTIGRIRRDAALIALSWWHARKFRAWMKEWISTPRVQQGGGDRVSQGDAAAKGALVPDSPNPVSCQAPYAAIHTIPNRGGVTSA
jgi:hypothetical protein